MPDLTDKQLEELASHAYTAFCESAQSFLPAFLPDFSLLPSIVRGAWKAAVAAVVRVLREMRKV